MSYCLNKLWIIIWTLPVPVPENLVQEKSTNTGKNLVPEKKTGTGPGKNSGYRHTLVSRTLPVALTRGHGRCIFSSFSLAATGGFCIIECCTSSYRFQQRHNWDGIYYYIRGVRNCLNCLTLTLDRSHCLSQKSNFGFEKQQVVPLGWKKVKVKGIPLEQWTSLRSPVSDTFLFSFWTFSSASDLLSALRDARAHMSLLITRHLRESRSREKNRE